ncbi:sterol desaturase family protein [Crocosphaera watsonii]|uniref:Fatty acid hydroxylase domain-containing protein n=1 Tax=Crocosphaera watsonii WH 0401 TaxID=555881 RepID=T2JD60_CROWT|nr:sterol desaturase family protein [Crocosphaera watsonii]CCQ62422.1 hypothetical protein CWATWH0401_1688 [Crocosphaera watsonii WH 0401]
MELFSDFLNFAKYILTGFLMYGFFMLIERIRPVEKHQPLSHVWFNLGWYVFYILVSFALQSTGIGLLIDLIQNWLELPLINLPVPHNPLTYGLIALLYFLVTDFFYYWFHRWQHTTWLWEQHKFHHSEVSLNVTSTRRVHWLEDPFLLFCLELPMGLLFKFNGLSLGIITFIAIIWLQFIHLNLRLNLGYLSRVITGPQYHRLHHSFQPEHLDKNFAAFFPLWDIVFKTYYHPRRDEFPPTGLTTGEVYNNLWEASLLPFREWLSSFRESSKRRKPFRER